MQSTIVFAFGMVGAVIDCAADTGIASIILAHTGASFLKKYPGTAARAYVQFVHFLRFYT